MNSSMIRIVLGNVLKIEGILMLIPIIVALIYGENTIYAFLITAGLAIVIGQLMVIKKPKDTIFYLKEGCISTALSWILLSIFGALPFTITGEIPSYVDALFETISGFTTTGASILPEVESLSKSILFWRSFTHWIGGMGVLVFLLAILPMTGGSNINLMKAESPGPQVGKLVPKVGKTARILYGIYIGLTVMQIICLLIAGMSFFDSVCTSLGTAGTGGFGIKNDSIGGYSPAIQWIVTIFMIAFGVNFNAYYYIIFKKFKQAFNVEEVKVYLGIIIASTAAIAINIVSMFNTVEEAVRASGFAVATVITTTGFSTVDFDTWPVFSKLILVLLMFVGACAGSTGGGIKVSRFIIAFKTIIKEFHSYIHPKSVKAIRIEGKTVEHETLRSVNVYFVTFAAVFTISLLIVSLENRDLVTSFTSVAATINNIGPGLAGVGPTCNFSSFSVLSKFVFMFDMLAGRLELFPMLILFHPAIWKSFFTSRIKPRKNKWEDLSR